MVENVTPGNSKGWINFSLRIFERAGPLTALILGICAYYVISGQQRELSRVHAVNREFFGKLEAAYVAQLDLARHCPPGGGER